MGTTKNIKKQVNTKKIDKSKKHKTNHFRPLDDYEIKVLLTKMI
jgi:hypothetical protein